MYCVRKLFDDLYYVGGSDRRIGRFENLFPLKNGVSYNSYLLIDEKTVLFDATDEALGQLFFENIEHVLGGRPLDYMVIHHMEPDHGALLGEIIEKYPSVKLVCTLKALDMIGRFFHMDVSERTLLVTEGDKLCTGKHTLRFLTAPMVHWPEVMVTYDELHGILFSADAFGAFGALPGNLIDGELDMLDGWVNEARRYYTNIVGKYGAPVQALLKKASALDVRMICSLHGPIWRDHIDMILDKYQKWSTYTPEEHSVVLIYASMYGNTANAVQVLASMLADCGVCGLRIYDASEIDASELVAECFRCSHWVFASPTYNGDMNPRMHTLLHELANTNIRGRTVGLIENGSWATMAGKKMADALAQMQDMTILDNTITMHSNLSQGQLASLHRLAEQLASGVLSAIRSMEQPNKDQTTQITCVHSIA